MERLAWFSRFLSLNRSRTPMWSADARQHIFDAWRATARKYGSVNTMDPAGAAGTVHHEER